MNDEILSLTDYIQGIGTTLPLYYTDYNNNIAASTLITSKCDYSDLCVCEKDGLKDDIKKMRRHISDMQTEINNLRAENQLLRNSLKDFVNEMKKIILKKEKNNE